MDPSNNSTQQDKIKFTITPELINTSLVLLSIVVVISLFIYVSNHWGETITCLVHPPSTVEIVIGLSSIVALVAALGVPFIQASAFGALAWLLIKAWMCVSPGA